MEKDKLISIVIPCYNEEKSIKKVLDNLLELEKQNGYKFEIIAVNDGSKDGTWEVIKGYAKNHPNVKGIDLMVNFGQTAAYQAGFDASHGDYVLTVSADNEIPLENIYRVIDYLNKGYDFVNTNRVGRWEGVGSPGRKKSGLANKIIARVSGVDMKDRGSGMKGFRRVLIENTRLYGEMHRFVPDYMSVFGARMIEFDVEFKDREYGESSYKGSKRTIKVLLDLVTLAFILYFAKKPFRAMPGRLFGFTGAVVTGMGCLIALYLAVLKVMGQSIGNRPLLILAVLMVIVGIQSMMMGMLGELMLRVYFESSGRKTYTVRELVSGSVS